MKYERLDLPFGSAPDFLAEGAPEELSPPLGKIIDGAKQDGVGVFKRAAFSSAWLIVSRFATKGIDFCVLLALAHLLAPSDFGIVAIAMTLVLIVEAIFELPISQVLVQMPSYEKAHLDTAFTISLLRGVAIGLILVGLSIPFSIFYHNDRLVPLISALGLAPAMRGLVSPALAKWAREVDFRREVALEVFGKLASLVVSVGIAIHYQSYWAIVAGTVMTPLGMMALSYVVAPYRPRISLGSWHLFSGFLGWTSAAQLVTAINWQCDRLLLAQFVSGTDLGEYSLANDLSYIPEQALIKPITRPLMSAFTLLRRTPAGFAESYMRVAVSLLVIGTPVMLGFSLLAEPAVRLVLGGKWMASVPILQWLALSLIPPLFSAPLGPLALASGRPDLLWGRSLVELVLKIPVVLLGAVAFGVPGVVAARLVSIAAMTLVDLNYARKLTGIPVFRQLLASWRVVCAGLVMATILIPLRSVATDAAGFVLAAQLAGLAMTGLAAYFAAIAILWCVAGQPDGVEASALRFARARWFRGTLQPA